jgi:hypothetical protein
MKRADELACDREERDAGNAIKGGLPLVISLCSSPQNEMHRYGEEVKNGVRREAPVLKSAPVFNFQEIHGKLTESRKHQ